MFKEQTTQNESPKQKKCYVVLFTLARKDGEDFCFEPEIDLTPLKIFTSHLRAMVHCEKNAREVQASTTSTIVDWIDDDTLLLYKEGGLTEMRWKIYETFIDDNIPANFNYPPIEEENESLRNECKWLREELADIMQRNAVAATYATMWDGGRNYTKEHVLENLQIVKDVLAGDHIKVIELFENWAKNRESK